MKVYIVVYYVEVGNITIENVFAERKDAEQYIKDLKPMDPLNYEVQEHEVR